MTDAIQAALAYVMPEGEDIEESIVRLYDEVKSAVAQCDGVIVEWQCELELAPGCGSLTVSVQRVGMWEEWIIARSDGHDTWPIITWNEHAGED
jgi:hypothetical protein